MQEDLNDEDLEEELQDEIKICLAHSGIVFFTRRKNSEREGTMGCTLH